MSFNIFHMGKKVNPLGEDGIYTQADVALQPKEYGDITVNEYDAEKWANIVEKNPTKTAYYAPPTTMVYKGEEYVFKKEGSYHYELYKVKEGHTSNTGYYDLQSTAEFTEDMTILELRDMYKFIDKESEKSGGDFIHKNDILNYKNYKLIENYEENIELQENLSSIDVESLNNQEKALYNETYALAKNEFLPNMKVSEWSYNKADYSSGADESGANPFTPTRYAKLKNYFMDEKYVGDIYPENILTADFNPDLDEAEDFLFDTKTQKYTWFGQKYYKSDDRYLLDETFDINYVPKDDETIHLSEAYTFHQDDFQNLDTIFSEDPDSALMYVKDIIDYKKSKTGESFYTDEITDKFAGINPARYIGYLEDNPEMYADFMKIAKEANVSPAIVFSSMMQEGLVENLDDWAEDGFTTDDILYSSNFIVDTYADIGLDATLDEQYRMNLEGDLIVPINYEMHHVNRRIEEYANRNLDYDLDDDHTEASLFRRDMYKKIDLEKYDFDNVQFDWARLKDTVPTRVQMFSDEGKQFLRDNLGWDDAKIDDLQARFYVSGRPYDNYSGYKTVDGEKVSLTRQESKLQGPNLRSFLGAGYHTERNEAGDLFTIGDVHLGDALKLGAGMLQLNQKAFLQDAENLGIDTSKISEDELGFWSYVYYNGGSGTGRKSLKKWGIEGYKNESWDTDLAFNSRRTAGTIKALNTAGIFKEEEFTTITSATEGVDPNIVKTLEEKGVVDSDTLNILQENIKTKLNLPEGYSKPADVLNTDEADDTSWLYPTEGEELYG